MTGVEAGVIWFVSWWMVLFTLLPLGVRSQEEEGDVTEGTEPGAPTKPLIIRKMIGASIGATIILALFYMGYKYQWVHLLSA